MELGKRAIALWLWVLVAVSGGIALIIANVEMLVSMVGVIAIILGLISLMPALMYTLEEGSDAAK